MAKVLVTGGTGLVGNRLARLLVERGHDVRALVRSVERAGKLLDGVELVPGDVTDRATIEPALDGIRWVFHCAGVPEQWTADPGIFDRVNRGGTANLLQAAKASDVERVVYTSTMDVFAAEPGGTLVETRLDHAEKPTAYERSKVAADREVERMVAEGLDVVHVCPGAVYGPSPVNVALNSLFLKLLNRQAPVLPPFGMSYVFVEGLAEAHLAAAEKGQAGERYLVADGYASNRELARAILSEAGRPRLPPTAPLWLLSAVAGAGEWAAARFGIDPLVSKGELALLAWDVRVDARKAREHLGFRPTPLADGVSKTVAHMRAQGLVPQS